MADVKKVIRTVLKLNTIGILFSQVYVVIASGLIDLIVEVINEITQVAIRQQVPDPNFASAVFVPDLSVSRAETDKSDFPDPVNQLLNNAINAQFKLAAQLAASATAANRVGAARTKGDTASASARLQEVKAHFNEAMRQQSVASGALRDFAKAIQGTNADGATDRNGILAFQEALLKDGQLPDQINRALTPLLAKMDPVIFKVVDPRRAIREMLLTLSASEPLPDTLSQALIMEADALSNICDVCGPLEGIHFPGLSAPLVTPSTIMVTHSDGSQTLFDERIIMGDEVQRGVPGPKAVSIGKQVAAIVPLVAAPHPVTGLSSVTTTVLNKITHKVATAAGSE